MTNLINILKLHPTRIKEKMMNKYQRFFGNVAIALQTKGIQMSYSTLNSLLADNGLEMYRSSRGLAKALSCAVKAWNKYESENDMAPATGPAIANSFTNKDGHLTWML